MFFVNFETDFTMEDALAVKAIEDVTNHDVKAVEYFLRDKLNDMDQLAGYLHFGCTSEDINNLAYARMVQESMNKLLKPAMRDLVMTVAAMVQTTAATPMLALTHGQPATPTTLGKELANFAVRLASQLAACAAVPVGGKMNGAVGNFNAHMIAHPEVNWPRVSKAFVSSLRLQPTVFTTQIEPHDWIAEWSHALSRFNTISLGLNRDMWGYISRGYFRQRVVQEEVGSSTMPHKVNPIYFENAEGNFGVSNALLGHLSDKLPVSRFQRDLSDSTVLRNIGTAMGHSFLACHSTVKGFGRLAPDADAMLRDLDCNYQVLTEAVQTVMRRHGQGHAYEQLKGLARGANVTAAELQAFVSMLTIPEDDKRKLLELTPSAYIGYAQALAQDAYASIISTTQDVDA